MMNKHPLTIVLSLFVAACSNTLEGGSNENAAHIACDNRALDSTCADYPAGTTKEQAQKTCDGKVVATTCPLERGVGACSVSASNGPITNTYYTDGPKPWTVESARGACNRATGSFKAQ